jgi:hypothetical protein
MVFKEIKSKRRLKACEAGHGKLEFEDGVKINGEDLLIGAGVECNHS